MSDSRETASFELNRLKRLQELCTDLPLEPATITQHDQALIESSQAGPNTTPISAQTSGTPKSIQQYDIHALVGRGGMGLVFRGHDRNLNRPVAIKLLMGHVAHEPKLVRRFKVEGEALARLEHPNIVPVYEAGDWEGIGYLAMKYVPGGTLYKHAARIRTDLRAAVTLMAKIARAVGYLHDRNMSHRDLKPANILLGLDDEPMVADFGLAKFHDTDSDLTMTGVLIGTRYYMAPEQTRSLHNLASPACDTWSLGVIFYELISGRLPFDSEEPEELFRLIRAASPPPLTSADGVPEPDLERIAKKCLAKNPSGRYRNCSEMADDLERWLRGEAIPATADRRSRWAAVGGAALAASVVVALLVAAMWKPAPIDAPVTIHYIGEDDTGVSQFHSFMPLAPGAIARDGRGRMTFGSKKHAFLSIGNGAYPGGTWFEATIQQLECDDNRSYAGLYCRGGNDAKPTGKAFTAVVIAIDSIEAADTTAQFSRPGCGFAAAGRWHPAQPTPWNFMRLPGQLALNRTHLEKGKFASIHHVRVEIKPDGTVTGTVSEMEMTPLTDEVQRTNLSYTMPFDVGPPMPRDDYFGTGLGLYVDSCRAAFWNVRAGSLN